jgi:hypothetical protein
MNEWQIVLALILLMLIAAMCADVLVRVTMP